MKDEEYDKIMADMKNEIEQSKKFLEGESRKRLGTKEDVKIVNRKPTNK